MGVALAGDWRRLDERIEGLSGEIDAVARQDVGCERLMSVPGIGPPPRQSSHLITPCCKSLLKSEGERDSVSERDW